jgi:hypothetical protein
LRRRAFIQDLKRSINGDGEFRQLLLNKDQVRQLALQPHTKALLVQHRAVWGQKAARLLQTSDELQCQVRPHMHPTRQMLSSAGFRNKSHDGRIFNAASESSASKKEKRNGGLTNKTFYASVWLFLLKTPKIIII